jgi:ABC-2 type transport system permease protein
MLKYLIEKEFKQIMRNSFLPKLIVFFPVLMLLIVPWVANLEVKDLKISIIDNDHSAITHRLKDKIIASGYFSLTDISSSNEQALRAIEGGKAEIILEFPADFERDLMRNAFARVMISANAVNGMQAGLGSSYLTSIINNFAAELNAENGSFPKSNLQITPVATQYKFNEYLDYKRFMIPALMVMLLTLLCGFLPALNIVGEKESGTIEQINVTPVSKLTFILGKLIPYWVIGFIALTLSFGVAFSLYGMFPKGSILTIYFFALIYILALSGLGIVVSNYSNTLQQAIFLIFFCVIILILVSGLFTPISSMPLWAQAITRINPLRYFMEVMRAVYLKGSGFMELLPQFFALLGFVGILNFWAVSSYRKEG